MELDKTKMDQADAEGEKNVNKQSSASGGVLAYLHDFAWLLAIVLLVFVLGFRVVVVAGSSMKATLLDGDYLFLVGNVFYSEPKYGDIIVASKDSFRNGEPIVKRVIATEGQTVDIDFTAGTVTVDGEVLEEPYINELTYTDFAGGHSYPLTVPEGCVFLMGDNRNHSTDSRHPAIGCVDTKYILGKVILRILPVNRIGTIQ